jgi:acetyl esterase
MSVSGPVRAVLDLMSAGFPPVGTELFDAAEARKLVSAAPRREPIPLARVEDAWIPGPSAAEGSASLHIRSYWPTADLTDAPGIVFFHGGGFVLCDLDSHDALCREIALRCDAVVVSVDYRRAPEDPCPAAAMDCWAATRWVSEHAAELGIDPAKLSVAGDSAGGNLAATVAYLASTQNGPPLQAQVLFYPMLDPQQDTASYRDFATGYFLTAAHLRWYWDCYLGPEPAALDPAYISPLRAPGIAAVPPALVVLAGVDPLHDDGLAYAERLKTEGRGARMLDFPGLFHGFMGLGAQLEEVAAAADQIYPLMRDLVSGPAA